MKDQTELESRLEILENKLSIEILENRIRLNSISIYQILIIIGIAILIFK